jgi:1-acyl-sn-glycerol-3-phosphate acyltransferase
VGFFPEGTTSEGDKLLKFHSSLFEPAVANRAHVQPVAIRYEHPDGTLCRAMGFTGDLSFAQSLGLVARQKHVIARVRFADPIDPAGLSRRDVAKIAQERIASLLGLPAPGSEPQTPSGP